MEISVGVCDGDETVVVAIGEGGYGEVGDGGYGWIEED